MSGGGFGFAPFFHHVKSWLVNYLDFREDLEKNASRIQLFSKGLNPDSYSLAEVIAE